MGFLRAEQNDMRAAKKRLRKALKADLQMAQAANKLCIITSEDRPDEALACRKAMELGPHDPKYAHALAFVQQSLETVPGV